MCIRDSYFFVRANATFTRVAILFREGLTGRDVVLVDPDEEHLGGVVDRSIWPDPAGERLAFGVSDPASRWMEVRVRDVATGRELPDRLRGLQARRVSNLSWNPDGTGVWYDGFAPPSGEDPRAARLRGARLAYHELGTEQGEDRIVLRAGPDETIDHRRTDDGRRVVAMVRDGRGVRAVHVLDASDPAAEPRLLADPAPQVMVQELADSSVNLQLRVWTSAGDFWDVWWDLKKHVKESVERAGLTIPFPQQDVWLRGEHETGGLAAESRGR